MIRDISEDTQRRVHEINPRYEDDISKRMADIRLSLWRGQELDTEYRTSQEARARINVSFIFMYFENFFVSPFSSSATPRAKIARKVNIDQLNTNNCYICVEQTNFTQDQSNLIIVQGLERELDDITRKAMTYR